MNKIFAVLAIAVLLLTAGVSIAAADNLIVNGGFETVDPDGTLIIGWNRVGTTTGVDVTDSWNQYHPNSGDYFAIFGEVNVLDGISQNISTINGQRYVLRMYLASDGGKPNEFKVDWNGITLYDQFDLPDTWSTTQYNLLDFSFIGTGNDTLTLSGMNNPSWLALDDVSLNPVPEPSSFLLIGAGLGVFALLRRIPSSRSIK
jgi:hypothetical protein